MLHISNTNLYWNKITDKSIAYGRKNSEFTLKIGGNNTVVTDNLTIIKDIRKLLPDYLCYGNQKGAKYLYRHGYIINRKKVRGRKSENNLLNISLQ